MAIRFPYLIAVEHPLRPGGNGTGRALAGAFIAGFAKPLQAEIDGLVMDHRHGGGDNTGFQPRPQIGIEDYLADAGYLVEDTVVVEPERFRRRIYVTRTG